MSTMKQWYDKCEKLEAGEHGNCIVVCLRLGESESAKDMRVLCEAETEAEYPALPIATGPMAQPGYDDWRRWVVDAKGRCWLGAENSPLGRVSSDYLITCAREIAQWDNFSEQAVKFALFHAGKRT